MKNEYKPQNPPLVLVDKESGEVLRIGSTIKTFRGEVGVLRSFQYPYDFKANKLQGGKVYVQLDGSTHQAQFYPSVIGAEFRENKDLTLVK